MGMVRIPAAGPMYCYRSSRRFPKAPDTEIYDIRKGDWSFVGWASIDGSPYCAWRMKEGGRFFYLFTLAQYSEPSV